MSTRSETTAAPLRVDFVPEGLLAGSGLLGMTMAPGRRGLGRFTGLHDRDLDRDLEHLRETYGAERVVSLVEEHELEALGIAPLGERVEAAGMTWTWFPFRDGSAPPSVPDTVVLVRDLLGSLEAGITVIVHCRAGLGRTGLLAACCLIASGHAPDAAVEHVRGARPGAIETPEQLGYLPVFRVGWFDPR